MQVENQRSNERDHCLSKSTETSSYHNATTTDAPSSFCSLSPSRNHSTANNIPSRELNKRYTSSKEKDGKKFKSKISKKRIRRGKKKTEKRH